MSCHSPLVRSMPEAYTASRMRCLERSYPVETPSMGPLGPTPSTVPAIALTPEQRAQLAPEQDPDELLRQVLAGTSVKWDSTIDPETAFQGTVMRIGLVDRDEFTEAQYWIGSTGHVWLKQINIVPVFIQFFYLRSSF